MKIQRINAKELAYISVLSSFWIVCQIYLGPTISRVTQIHGVAQRTVGWFLMLILAYLTQKFGRVTMMSVIASLATRIARPVRLYSIFVGAGYAIGGLAFDLLFFMPFFHLRASSSCRKLCYLLVISLLSSLASFFPYILFNFFLLDLSFFLLSFLPLYSISMIKSVTLGMVGTSIGFGILPRIELSNLTIRKE